MPIHENKTDTEDDTPSAAKVLADETDKSVDEFTPDSDEYPQIHPDDASTRDLRDSK